MEVPFVDLRILFDQIGEEALAAVQRVAASSDFILGKEVTAFEAEFAAYCGVKHAVGLDSGVSALELALRACGVGPGDEVITVSHTFIATVSAVSFVGATPVFVDIDPRTYTMDPARISAAITSRTKAIIPVHLYGQPAEMDAILDIARRHGLTVIEDACQAHGAQYKGRRVGGIGEIGCFSFYPAKNLGAWGDGGMFTTNRDDYADTVRMLRNYGQRQKYQHEFLAYNRRLDTVQAALLRVKLHHLDGWNTLRQDAARQYGELLRDVPAVTVPHVMPDRTHVYHLYVIQIPNRDAALARLRQAGVQAGLHYPTPVHRQPCYRFLNVPPDALPVTDSAAAKILSLPMYPGIRPEAIRYVCDRLRAG